jgi:hypothetical protein
MAYRQMTFGYSQAIPLSYVVPNAGFVRVVAYGFAVTTGVVGGQSGKVLRGVSH